MKIVVSDGVAKNWEEAIILASNKLLEKGYVQDSFGKHCIEREKKFPTGLETDFPVAIPHTESEYVNETAISVVRFKDPVVFKNMEDSSKQVKVHYVMNLAIKDKNQQVVFLSKVIQIVQDSNFLKRLFSLDEHSFEDELLKKFA